MNPSTSPRCKTAFTTNHGKVTETPGEQQCGFWQTAKWLMLLVASRGASGRRQSIQSAVTARNNNVAAVSFTCGRFWDYSHYQSVEHLQIISTATTTINMHPPSPPPTATLSLHDPFACPRQRLQFTAITNIIIGWDGKRGEGLLLDKRLTESWQLANKRQNWTRSLTLQLSTTKDFTTWVFCSRTTNGKCVAQWCALRASAHLNILQNLLQH